MEHAHLLKDIRLRLAGANAERPVVELAEAVERVCAVDPARLSADDIAILGLAARALADIASPPDAMPSALVDAITGVGNRLSFDDRLTEEVSRASRYGRALSLLTFDLRGFSAVNDGYGHDAGDHVLREFAAILSEQRAGDSVFRLASERFALLLPETDASGADVVGRRVEGIVANPGLGYGRLGVSWGVAELRTDAETLEAEAEPAAAAR